MSTEDTTSETEAVPSETTAITVEVPAHRAAQFERFHERFLQMAARWDAQVGNEDLCHRPGRGRGRHGGGRRGRGRRGRTEA